MALPTFAQIEDAIQAAVVAGTGLTASNVRWANQSEPNQYSTANTYATLAITSSTLGSPEPSQQAAVAPQTGYTLVSTSELMLEVEVQVFNFVTTGVTSSFAVCNQLASYLQMDTTDDTLDAAILSLVDIGPIQHIPRLLQNKYQDRAVVTITMRSLIASSANVPYIISHVDGDVQANQVDGSHTHHPF